MRVFSRVSLPLMAGLMVLCSAAAADDSIYDIRLGGVPAGTVVTVQDVVVTGVGRFGFFVQEPIPDGTWGRQFSGIWIYTNSIPTVRRGDHVNVTGGYEEYYGQSEINLPDYNGSYVIVGQGPVPDPVQVTIPEVNNTGPLAENYECVLIRVDREDDTLISYPPDQYDEWWLKRGVGEDSLLMESYSALPGGDFEYDIPDSGTILSFAQGIHTYSFNQWKLAPRNCDTDLGTSCRPRLRGAYAKGRTEVGVQFGVPVTEASAENISNYELASGYQILDAELDPQNPKIVTLTTEDLGDAEEEALTVHGVISQQGAPMSGYESAAFRSGYTPIHMIQYVQDPSATDISPLYNETVTVRGRVTGFNGPNYQFLQDDDGGPWDGLYVYIARPTWLQVGDVVAIAGRVREYYGMTELGYFSGCDYFTKLGYQSSVITNTVTCSQLPYRDDPNTSEPWEGCPVRLESAVLDSLLGVVGPYYAEWLLFQAGDPDTAQTDFDEINGSKGYAACLGDRINVRGFVGNAFGEYTIWPEWGRGIDIEVIYDNPACEASGVDEAGLAAGRLDLTSHPNPFNPRTTIRFRLDARDQVRLDIHDASGRLVRTLIDDAAMDAGQKQAIWDGRDNQGHLVETGTYFARIQTTKGLAANKMIMLK